MTPDAFRRLALSFPDAVECEHMGHPDFRVGVVGGKGGRIFASLFGGPEGEACGMIKVTPDEQEALIGAHPGVFEPCAGAWGRQGCTAVRLESARVAVVSGPMASAWGAALAKQGREGGKAKTRRRE